MCVCEWVARRGMGVGVGQEGEIRGCTYSPSLVCPSFQLFNRLLPKGRGVYDFVVTPIPAFLSGLTTLSAYVYLFTLFPCGQHNFLLCSSTLLVILHSLSPFSYCLAPLARHLGLRFASTQYLDLNGMRPCPCACTRCLLLGDKLSLCSVPLL